MKLNFNGKDGKKGYRKTDVRIGSYEDMLKERERRMPEMQAELQKLFDNWSGETIIIIKAENDENGDPTGHHELILGVDKPTVLLGMMKHLDQTQETLMHSLVENGDPRMLMAMAADMMKDILKEISDDKKN